MNLFCIVLGSTNFVSLFVNTKPVLSFLYAASIELSSSVIGIVLIEQELFGVVITILFLFHYRTYFEFFAVFGVHI